MFSLQKDHNFNSQWSKWFPCFLKIDSILLLSTEPFIYISQTQSIRCSAERYTYGILVLKSYRSSSGEICTSGTLRVKEKMHLAQGVGWKDTKCQSCNKPQSREDSDWTRRLGIERAGDEPREELGLVGESQFVIPWVASGVHRRYSGNNTTHIIYLERTNLTSCIQNSHRWTHQETKQPRKGERNKRTRIGGWRKEVYTHEGT